jgi:hypothetical protein
MDDDMRQVMEKAKNALREKSSNMTFGIIEDRVTNEELRTNDDWIEDSLPTLQGYLAFIMVYSGASLGSILLYRFNELKRFRNSLDFLPNWEEEWLCIGKIMSEPIGLNKRNGNVYWFSEIPFEDEGICLGQFDDFLKNVVFGEKYAEIVPWIDEDEWYQFQIVGGSKEED